VRRPFTAENAEDVENGTAGMSDHHEMTVPADGCIQWQ